MNQPKRPHKFKFIDFYIVINRDTKQSVDGVEYETRGKAEKAMNEREDRRNLTIAMKRKQG
jgi:hypothetical protein